MTSTLHGTCNLACWQAREPVCHCMCGGVNHGLMAQGGDQPGRYCQRKGRQFELHEIYPRWGDAQRTAYDLSKQLSTQHGLPWFSESAFEQHATGHMLKWPEVQRFLADHHHAYLVWTRIFK